MPQISCTYTQCHQHISQDECRLGDFFGLLSPDRTLAGMSFLYSSAMGRMMPDQLFTKWSVSLKA